MTTTMNSLVQVSLYALLWIFQDCYGKTIQTTTGLVKGVTKDGRNVEAYLGIPYAEPPINKLRFERPLAKKPWKGVYNAESLPPSCMQNNTGNYYEPSMDTPMSEDCLFLNLWVPDSEGLKTVMVFIHGGAFTIGSSNMKLYDGTNLASKGDVIVATLNYRLGAFGFLLLEGGEVNGNMGAFDLIMALKWIKTNIRAFGGDPDNVVLFGESSGSGIIGGFILSPLTRTLFRRAIMQSGAPVSPMGLYNNAQVTTVSKKIARLSGCAKTKDNNPKGVASCMKNLEAKTIADAEAELKMTPFNVVIRTHDDLIPNDAPHLLSYGNFSDTEVMIGTNEDEGALFMFVAAPDYFRDGQINLGSKSLARGLIRMVLQAMDLSKVADEVSSYYVNLFGNGTSASYLKAFQSTLGDYIINCGSYFQSEFMSLKNPVYYYVMKYRPATTALGKWAKMTHFDELQYVFGNPMFESFTPEEEAFSDKIMKRWTAFAKTGNPNIPGYEEWPRFKREDPKYLVLSEEDNAQTGRPYEGRCEIWRKKFQTIFTKEVLANFKSKTESSSS